jgi:hypothetical protein
MARQSEAKISHRRNSQSLISRGVIGAWVMGGGIWVLGMAGLMAAPVTADITTVGVTAANYYTHSGAWQTYTDPSGKYTVVIRSLVHAGKL